LNNSQSSSEKNKKPKILVHICCAPDALYVLDILKKNYDVSGYFYNPNIHPEKEYFLRLEETRDVAKTLGVVLHEDIYDAEKWFDITHQFRTEPEKGLRCDVCYAIRLKKTAQKTKALDLDFFTTVMSLSPWKKAEVINRIGRMFASRYGVKFMEANFKKKDGFKKSIELSKRHELYRQNYCGCLYSQDSKKKI
jgi:predicted adenine nucleotide alpha hydrolase (AANH) superfamily ATPase